MNTLSLWIMIDRKGDLKMKIEELFEFNAKKYGKVVWNDYFSDYELALTQDPYPFGVIEDWFFQASAMDRSGNLWYVVWQPRPDADDYDAYDEQVVDWDKPCHAEMIDIGYYLDD